MTNCLSDSSFENLLFVHVHIQEAESIALFDTGAGMTVISRSLLARLGITAENAALRTGNNNGLLRTLQTAVLSHVRSGDICVETLRVLVTGDADFALSDSSGAAFPAEMLLGWDVIARYRWRYSVKDGTLSVSTSERDGAPADPDGKQGPIVFPTYAGRRFKARVDTGHSDSTLSAVWHTRLPDIERHEAEMVGIGFTQCAATPYVRCLPLRFQKHLIRLRKVNGEIIDSASLNRKLNRMRHRAEFGISLNKACWGCDAATPLARACSPLSGKLAWSRWIWRYT